MEFLPDNLRAVPTESVPARESDTKESQYLGFVREGHSVHAHEYEELAIGAAASPLPEPSLDFGAWEASGTGFGSRMLSKMGWERGEGLGRAGRRGAPMPLAVQLNCCDPRCYGGGRAGDEGADVAADVTHADVKLPTNVCSQPVWSDGRESEGVAFSPAGEQVKQLLRSTASRCCWRVGHAGCALRVRDAVSAVLAAPPRCTVHAIEIASLHYLGGQCEVRVEEYYRPPNDCGVPRPCPRPRPRGGGARAGGDGAGAGGDGARAGSSSTSTRLPDSSATPPSPRIVGSSTAGRVLLPWGNYGEYDTTRGGWTLAKAYTPVRVAVVTDAVAFRISVRCTEARPGGRGARGARAARCCAGVAHFALRGPPPPTKIKTTRKQRQRAKKAHARRAMLVRSGGGGGGGSCMTPWQQTQGGDPPVAAAPRRDRQYGAVPPPYQGASTAPPGPGRASPPASAALFRPRAVRLKRATAAVPVPPDSARIARGDATAATAEGSGGAATPELAALRARRASAPRDCARERADESSGC